MKIALKALFIGTLLFPMGVWAEETETALQGIRFTPDAIRSALASVSFSSEPCVREDLENLLQRMTNR